MKNKSFVIGIVITAIAGFAAAAIFMKVPSKGSEVFRVDATKLVRSHSYAKGNPEAKVTLVEFFDPECEACREMHPVVNALVADYGDRLRVVYRFTPLHPGSVYASSVLFEALSMGKFEEALELLFKNQPEWGSHENPQPQLIPRYLAPLGFTAAQLENGRVIAKYKAQLALDQSDSASLLVQQTPTFFVNGRPTFSIDESVLRRMIDTELSSEQSR